MGAAPQQRGVGTFYIDASVPEPVRIAIASVRSDVLYAGGPNAPAVNTSDTAWLAQAGAENWIVIHRDKKIRTRVWERTALFDAGVRAFYLTKAGSHLLADADASDRTLGCH